MDVKDPLARIALEVVVVLVRGQLVQRIQARQVHRLQLATLRHVTQMTVHRGDAERRNGFACDFENLLRRQGPMC